MPRVSRRVNRVSPLFSSRRWAAVEGADYPMYCYSVNKTHRCIVEPIDRTSETKFHCSAVWEMVEVLSNPCRAEEGDRSYRRSLDEQKWDSPANRTSLTSSMVRRRFEPTVESDDAVITDEQIDEGFRIQIQSQLIVTGNQIDDFVTGQQNNQTRIESNEGFSIVEQMRTFLEQRSHRDMFVFRMQLLLDSCRIWESVRIAVDTNTSRDDASVHWWSDIRLWSGRSKPISNRTTSIPSDSDWNSTTIDRRGCSTTSNSVRGYLTWVMESMAIRRALFELFRTASWRERSTNQSMQYSVASRRMSLLPLKIHVNHD